MAIMNLCDKLQSWACLWDSELEKLSHKIDVQLHW